MNYPVIDLKRTGETIKLVMRSRGFKVSDLQEYLGLECPQSIYYWFRGECLPSLDNLYALSELFGLPIDTFIRGSRKFVFVPFGDIENGRMYKYFSRLQKLVG